jgi:hypothetical protein
MSAASLSFAFITSNIIAGVMAITNRSEGPANTSIQNISGQAQGLFGLSATG